MTHFTEKQAKKINDAMDIEFRDRLRQTYLQNKKMFVSARRTYTDIEMYDYITTRYVRQPKSIDIILSGTLI